MKLGLPLLLLVAMFGVVGFSAGCHHDDNHHKASIKVDTKGSDKGVEIKKD